MYVYVCICMYMYVYVCICMYMYVYVCICMYMYVYVCIYLYIFVYICIYLYIYSVYICVYGLYYIHMIYVREDVSYADVPGIPAIPWTVSASWTSAVGLFGWTMSGFTTMMSWWFYQEQWGLNGICSWFMRVAKLVYNVLNCWVD